MPNYVARAHLALALAATLFGGLNVVLEIGLKRHDDSLYQKIGRSTVFALYRDVGAAVLLACTSARSSQWRQPAAWIWHRTSTVLMVLACGFFGIYAQLAFIVGLALTNANLAALFQPAAPVLTVMLAVLTGAEGFSLAKALAITLALAGAILTCDLAHASTPSLLGVACFVTNLLGISIWLSIQKLVLLRGVPYLPLIVLTYASGALFVAITAVAAFAGTSGVWELNVPEACALGYAVLFASAFCYWLMAWAANYLDPSYISLWQVMQPITSGVLCFTFLDERMTPLQIGGGLLICLGLVICCVASLREHKLAGERVVLLHGTVSDQPLPAAPAAGR